jgi:hypothetical protein
MCLNLTSVQPRYKETNETQEYILKCWSVGAHKKWYDLVHPMMKKIRQNNLCQVQEVFSKWIRSWLESPESVIQDVSSVTKNALVCIWQWESTSASIGDWQYLWINILRRTMTRVNYR